MDIGDLLYNKGVAPYRRTSMKTSQKPQHQSNPKAKRSQSVEKQSNTKTDKSGLVQSAPSHQGMDIKHLKSEFIMTDILDRHPSVGVRSNKKFR